MKKIIQDWIWSFLGYKCCRPPHTHVLESEMKEFSKRINDNIQSQLNESRGQLFEFFRQQGQEEKEKIINVRIVK